MSWAVSIGTIAALMIAQAVFGALIGNWIASVLLAFCIGTFWGAGDQLRKQRERDGEGS